MLSTVISRNTQALSIPQIAGRFAGLLLLVFSVFLLSLPTESKADENAGQSSAADQGEEFLRAWQAAREGNRALYHQLMPDLQGYLLYPYLQYEDLRFRRASVDAQEMADFLQTHEDWPFTSALRKVWLRSLGEKGRWDDLLLYAGDATDTEIRCYQAQARIERGQTDGLLPIAQGLWAVGKSQPDACDAVFSWLKKQKGISSGLAWERIRLAMVGRDPRLTLYLARYTNANDQVWVKRWQEQERGGYYRLNKALQWSDQEKGRVITEFGLRRLARSNSDRAAKLFDDLEGRFGWSADARGGILREIALWSAVEGASETSERMRKVPAAYRDDKLLEWWARFELAQQHWADVVLVIDGMSPELKQDSRWRYWDARARLEVGDQDYPMELLNDLAADASYYGFLSADYLDQPYSICPQEPGITSTQIDELRQQPAFQRSLELRRLGIRNWSRSEWQMAVRSLDKDGLRLAAGLATEENWPDMAIFALGNSGDLQWYEWRFPIEYSELIGPLAESRKLDASWVMGLMRAESAMAIDAKSSAGALGLMQIMPDTARLLSKRHGIPYGGTQTLVQPEANVKFGTAYLRDLLDRFDDNPVLATGSYNAGPGAVERWLKSQPTQDPAVWIETLPYYETRDYIPRVLAFSTIYDWRRQQPIRRISARMPDLKSGTMGVSKQNSATTEVVCMASG